MGLELADTRPTSGFSELTNTLPTWLWSKKLYTDGPSRSPPMAD